MDAAAACPICQTDVDWAVYPGGRWTSTCPKRGCVHTVHGGDVTLDTRACAGRSARGLQGHCRKCLPLCARNLPFSACLHLRVFDLRRDSACLPQRMPSTSTPKYRTFKHLSTARLTTLFGLSALTMHAQCVCEATAGKGEKMGGSTLKFSPAP
jgi:hypothetical protein